MRISRILLSNFQCLCVAAYLAIAGASHAGAWQWIEPARVQGMIKEGSALWLIDVRSGADYEHGHIEGSVNIPYSGLAYKKFPVNRALVLVDDSLGLKLAREAAEGLIQRGQERVYVLDGGMVLWKLEGLSVVERKQSVRGVTDGELKWALDQKVPLRIFDMREAREKQKGKIQKSEPVDGNTLHERVAKLRKLLKKEEGKDLLGRLRKPQPVVLVFSATDDAEGYARSIQQETKADVRYLIGGYETTVSGKIRGRQTAGACPTCPGKVQ